MSYETIIEQVKAVPQDRLGELETFIVTLVEEGRHKSCRGIASEYANPALIPLEAKAAAQAFATEEL